MYEVKKFLPVFLLASLYLPEILTNHVDSRNSKDIQGCCEHLEFSWNFLNLHGYVRFSGINLLVLAA